MMKSSEMTASGNNEAAASIINDNINISEKAKKMASIISERNGIGENDITR